MSFFVLPMWERILFFDEKSEWQTKNILSTIRLCEYRTERAWGEEREREIGRE
jgi:hypothetical protein